jgi:hypothetical protein
VVSARQQALAGFPLLLLVQLVQFGVRYHGWRDFPGLAYFLGPCFGHAAVAVADLSSSCCRSISR